MYRLGRKPKKRYDKTIIFFALIILLLILNLFNPVTAIAEGAGNAARLGDCNGDGNISITDYTLTRLHILGLKCLEGEYREAADINGDGQITITDYTWIRLDILGLKQIGSGGDLPLLGYKIGLDPGHQQTANNDREPISPNGTDMKKKVSSGTQGRFTGVPEYVVNLQVGLKLKSKLEALGATVIMTRETHDVDISNAERAVMMNEAGVDCWLRIHANGSEDPDIHGMFILVPAAGCMDTDDGRVVDESVHLAEILLEHTVTTTGAKNLGITSRSDQTGFCWSKVPVCNIEMGHMTNEAEDHLLVSDAYQEKIAEGLANGFIAYFSS